METASMRKLAGIGGGAVRAIAVALLTLAAAAGPGAAKQANPAPAPAPDDVASPDAIIAALYESISGPVGQPRDWDRFLSLFIPGARLIPTSPTPQGGYTHNVITPEQYMAGSAEGLARIGFREREIARTSESFGSMVHAFSTYEGFRGDETEPFLRGINSIQLFNDGTRWWIVTVFWSPEHPGDRLPAKYLP